MHYGPRNKHSVAERGLHAEPYGCNMPSCLHLTFPTLTDVRNHWSETHLHNKAENALDVKKYRCTIADCGRVYKNLAGLRYHLESTEIPVAETSNAASARPGRPAKARDANSQAIDGGRLTCPVYGCHAQYRQISGLRYHLVRHDPAPSLDHLRDLNPELAERLNGRGNAYIRAQFDANRPKVASEPDAVSPTTGKKKRRPRQLKPKTGSKNEHSFDTTVQPFADEGFENDEAEGEEEEPMRLMFDIDPAVSGDTWSMGTTSIAQQLDQLGIPYSMAEDAHFVSPV